MTRDLVSDFAGAVLVTGSLHTNEAVRGEPILPVYSYHGDRYTRSAMLCGV